jgi:hypothetical protein
MGLRGEIFSLNIGAGNRTYFFNVKENRNGDVFLNIVESKKKADGDFERFSIMVFEEDVDKFAEGLNKALHFMKLKKE